MSESDQLRPTPTHGVKGYVKYGCRCPVCTAANTRRAGIMRAARRVRVAQGDPAVPHGTQGGYTNWGCHCKECTRANTDYCAKRKLIRKQESVTIP